jgi:hypothetical protein
MSTLGEILHRAWKAARDAIIHQEAEHESAAPAGTCTHRQASPSYRPPGRLHDFIIARDQTCRFPRCRQPAWRGDLDHTVPYENGGPTCACKCDTRSHMMRVNSRIGGPVCKPAA